MTTHQPLVLGAGVAGLASAVELARAGLRPTVVEARPFVGGRVRSFTHEPTGDEIDNGQHLLMGCYHATFRLLDLIGTRDLVAVQQRLLVEFRDADGRSDRLAASSLLPSPLDVLAGMLRLRRLSLRERIGLLRVAVAALRIPRRDEPVDRLLARLGQSPAARERLWEPIVIATLNTPAADASSRLFLEVMRRAFLGSGDDSRLALPRAGLSRLIEPAVEYITAQGGTVALGASVTRVERLSSGFVVRLKSGEEMQAGQIVGALPPRSSYTLLGGMIDAGRTSPAIALSPIVSLYLWFDRPLLEVPEMTALLGTRVQWVFNRRRMLEGPSETGLLSCTISAADEETAASGDEVIAIAERELRRAFAEIGDARLIDALAVKEKHATFRAVPGIDERRPGSRTHTPGLYLAGDWTATSLPATIEGAAQSGFAAAEALLEDLKHEGRSHR